MRLLKEDFRTSNYSYAQKKDKQWTLNSLINMQLTLKVTV